MRITFTFLYIPFMPYHFGLNYKKVIPAEAGIQISFCGF